MKRKNKRILNFAILIGIICGLILAFKGISIELNTGESVEVSSEAQQENIPKDTIKEEGTQDTGNEKEIISSDEGKKEDNSKDTSKNISNTGENVNKDESYGNNYISMTISCTNLLNNMEALKESKRPLVPSNGILYSNNKIQFKEGDTVFDVLLRESRAKRLHMDFVETPMYNSAYIKGIGNIYEFDAGDLSGWMYSVNGEFPGFGCSQYKLKAGDNIQWKYTLDLGSDVRR